MLWSTALCSHRELLYKSGCASWYSVTSDIWQLTNAERGLTIFVVINNCDWIIRHKRVDQIQHGSSKRSVVGMNVDWELWVLQSISPLQLQVRDVELVAQRAHMVGDEWIWRPNDANHTFTEHRAACKDNSLKLARLWEIDEKKFKRYNHPIRKDIDILTGAMKWEFSSVIY